MTIHENIKEIITTKSISKNLFLLTIPIALTFAFIQLADTMDTIFSSKYDKNTLAAISIATIVSILPLSIINGIVYTSVPQYSYLKQKNKTDEIFNLIIEYLIISFTLSLLISFLFIYFTPIILELMHIDHTLIPQVKIYLNFLFPFILGMMAYNNFYYFSESYGFPIFAAITVFISLLIKGILIYIFVFSDWVQESWGIAGFGLAGVFFAWSKFLILLIFILFYKEFRVIWQNPISRLSLSLTRILKNIIKGTPNSLSALSERGAFFCMGLMIAKLGVNEIGAHAIVFSIIPVALVIEMAFSRSLAILVAQYQDQKIIVKKTIYIGTAVALALIFVTCMILLSFSQWIISHYSIDPELLPIVNQIYPIMLILLFFWGVNNIFCFILRGFSDFFMVFLILFTTSWLIFIPLGYILSSTNYIYLAQGILGWWYSLTLSYIASVCFSFARLYFIVKKIPDDHSIPVLFSAKEN